MANDKMQGIMKGEFGSTIPPNVPPVVHQSIEQSIATARKRKAAVISVALLLIAGAIYLIKTKPKAAMYIGGGLVALFAFVYFFVGIFGPSKWQQFKTSLSPQKLPSDPTGAIHPIKAV